MSSNIIASIQPAKERLVNLLLEINSIELKSPEPDTTIEQQEILYTMRNRTLEDKLRRIQLCIKTLQSISDDWLKYTRTIASTKKEEKASEVITMGETGIYQTLQQVSNLPSTPNVHRPQLSLPTFNGDPRQWRQFWSSFNAAVHSQPIPEIQKLNYLYSCLNGNALEVVLGYDIAPENYEIVRRLLREKYGDPSAATTILYKELRSIKRDEKEWVKMVEHIEKVIRQLEALGENMEHSSIEHWIENKLPEWILDKVFEQKELDATWSVSKLRNFLLKRVNRSEKVKNCQKLNTQADSKLTTTKFVQKQRYSPVGTSALSTIQSLQKVSQPTIKRRRPCVFCTRDHWDSECDVYSTV
uniref:Gag protein n=2 Tax=Loa loa TaxID=7209 RepID=A0A1I7VGP7_LOALO